MSVSSRSSTGGVPPYVVRSSYAFDAAEDVELSVAADELLVTTSPSLQEEWVLVSRVVSGEVLDLAKGYVPGGYLSVLAEPEASGETAVALIKEYEAARKARRKRRKAAAAGGSAGVSRDSVSQQTPPRPASPGATAASTASTGDLRGFGAADSDASGDAKTDGADGKSKEGGSGGPAGSVVTVVASGGGGSGGGRGEDDNATGAATKTSGATSTTSTSSVTTASSSVNTSHTSSPGASQADAGDTTAEGTVTSLQALADLCAQHEERVREVSARREETFTRLQGSLSTALEQIEACKRKNEALTRRLDDMDKLIDEERQRWMSQVDAVAKGVETN